jgi:glycyl-radical enzyme activating protein/glucokinase-like ROK family protein
MNEWVIGVDLGGTKIEVGLVSPENQILERCRIPTNPHEGPRRVVERIAECVETLAVRLPPGTRLAALGICSPGPVDHETGTLIDPPNLAGLHNAPLRELLSERLHLPVSLEHDAKAAALGEFHFGVGRGERNMVYVVVGTGVGAAIILNGELLRGPDNSAGEIGHVTLDKNGDVCSCGSHGCVETFVSGPWLAKRYNRLLAAQLPGSKPTNTESVVAWAGAGDRLALQVMAEAGDALGTAIDMMAMILNIDLFVIGGSVAKAGDILLEPTRQALPKHAFRSVGCGLRVVATELGDDGPVLGCAWLARQALKQSPQTHPYAIQAVERAKLEAVEGIIFNVQRFSVHDGPGLRTNVFFKGCSLRCGWCANPESQKPRPELMLSAGRCVNCGQFAEACTVAWAVGGWTQAAREQYSERVAACPTCAVTWVGERRTAGSIIEEVLRDLPFYGAVGGLTLTGGEPTFQPHLAEALLRLAKEHGLSTAMETSGHTRWKVFERLLPHLDHILFDIKHVDPAVHREFTGVDNLLILANLKSLAAAGAPVEVRVPLIPGFNADETSITAIADFLSGMDGLSQDVRLLPYHTFGQAKYRALGRNYPWEPHQRLTETEVQSLAGLAESRGLHVRIGG